MFLLLCTALYSTRDRESASEMSPGGRGCEMVPLGNGSGSLSLLEFLFQVLWATPTSLDPKEEGSKGRGVPGSQTL